MKICSIRSDCLPLVDVAISIGVVALLQNERGLSMQFWPQSRAENLI